jgi:hypothetical protein
VNGLTSIRRGCRAAADAACAVAAMAGLLVVGLSVFSAPADAQSCCGDCNGDQSVAIEELVTVVTNGLTECPAAGCCGDCNLSGEVRINEMVTSVQNALDDCVVLKFCPINLTAAQSVGCSFRGRFNGACGGELEARLVADQGRVVVELGITGRILEQPEGGIAYGPLDAMFIKANMETHTEASLVGWFTTPDEHDLMMMRGRLSISDGRHLVVEPYLSEVTFTLSGCRFKRFEGTLTEIR